MVGSKMGDVVIATRHSLDGGFVRPKGRLKLDELISGRWSLEQINEAIADTKTGSAQAQCDYVRPTKVRDRKVASPQTPEVAFAK